MLAVMPEVTGPWGRGADGGTDFLLSFLTGRDITGRIHTDGEYAVSSLSAGDARFTQQLLSLSTSVAVTRNLQSYVEVYWFSHTDPSGPRFVGIDAGATWMLNQRTAFDVAIDTSLSDASMRPALMFGLSRILGEVAGHRGVATRMRDAQRRGDR